MGQPTDLMTALTQATAPLIIVRAGSRTGRAACLGGWERAVQAGDPHDLNQRWPRRGQPKLAARPLRIAGCAWPAKVILYICGRIKGYASRCAGPACR